MAKSETMVVRIRQYRPADSMNNLSPAPIALGYLEYIVQQVQSEGYYVEYIASFAAETVDTTETIDAIYRWAKLVGLSVSINQERGICFFEKL